MSFFVVSATAQKILFPLCKALDSNEDSFLFCVLEKVPIIRLNFTIQRQTSATSHSSNRVILDSRSVAVTMVQWARQSLFHVCGEKVILAWKAHAAL